MNEAIASRNGRCGSCSEWSELSKSPGSGSCRVMMRNLLTSTTATTITSHLSGCHKYKEKKDE